MQEVSPAERVEALQKLASKMEMCTYSRQLTEEEITALEKNHVRKSIDVNRMKDEKKENAQQYKAKIDAVETDLKKMLDEINVQKREVKGTLYHIPNHKDGKMLMYDANGELIDSRPLKAEEKQLRLEIDGPANKTEEPVQDAEEVGKSDTEEGRWDGEIVEQGSTINRPGDTGDPEWQEFEKKAADEAAAKAAGNKKTKKK